MCRSLTDISIKILEKKSVWFDYGLKTVTTSLGTHAGLALGRDSIHSKIYSLGHVVILLYLDRPLIAFRVIFFIKDIYARIFLPILTKLRAALQPRFFSFNKCFILGTNFYLFRKTSVHLIIIISGCILQH